MWGSAGRMLQAEGIANSEAVRRKCFWCIEEQQEASVAGAV